MDWNSVFFIEAVGDEASIEDGLVGVDEFYGILLLWKPHNCTGLLMIDLYLSDLALVLEESHQFVYFVVVFRNVLYVYAVFSLSLLSCWLFVIVLVVVLRRRTCIWLRHRMNDWRLRNGIIHGFAFWGRRRRWRDEGLASKEQRGSEDWFWCWRLYILILLDYLMRLTVRQFLLLLLLNVPIRIIGKIGVLVEHILLFLVWHWFAINLNDKLN